MTNLTSKFPTEIISKKTTSKSWCFTINNYTEKIEQLLEDFEKTYMCVGKEVGENGTKHLQGFIIWKRAYKLPGLKKLIPTAHWEPAIASDAMNYCMKEGNYKITDNRKQGKRTDLDNVVECNSIKEVVDQYPTTYIKFHAGIDKYISRKQKPRDFAPEVYWLWGPTGTGKTKSVTELEKDLWWSGKDLKFWNNYENQEAVILDDFRGDFCTFHELLRILDRYEYTVNTKGGFKTLNSKRMYITTCHPPTEVYLNREDVGQLLRRITKIIHVTKDTTQSDIFNSINSQKFVTEVNIAKNL